MTYPTPGSLGLIYLEIKQNILQHRLLLVLNDPLPRLVIVAAFVVLLYILHLLVDTIQLLKVLVLLIVDLLLNQTELSKSYNRYLRI